MDDLLTKVPLPEWGQALVVILVAIGLALTILWRVAQYLEPLRRSIDPEAGRSAGPPNMYQMLDDMRQTLKSLDSRAEHEASRVIELTSALRSMEGRLYTLADRIYKLESAQVENKGHNEVDVNLKLKEVDDERPS